MFQNCEIFLCGTKLDLIKNGQERKIDRNNVGDYADGKKFYFIISVNFTWFITINYAGRVSPLKFT